MKLRPDLENPKTAIKKMGGGGRGGDKLIKLTLCGFRHSIRICVVLPPLEFEFVFLKPKKSNSNCKQQTANGN
jgi:hypothetical protein